MTLKLVDDIKGLEYDWLAVDADGHVGLFSTAGGGHVPTQFLQDTDLHERGIDALIASPSVTRSRFFPDVATGLPNTWKAAAEKGLYAFDSDPNGGPYRLVASPEAPAAVTDVPEEARSAASKIILKEVRFGALEEDAVLPWP